MAKYADFRNFSKNSANFRIPKNVPKIFFGKIFFGIFYFSEFRSEFWYVSDYGRNFRMKIFGTEIGRCNWACDNKITYFIILNRNFLESIFLNDLVEELNIKIKNLFVNRKCISFWRFLVLMGINTMNKLCINKIWKFEQISKPIIFYSGVQKQHF